MSAGIANRASTASGGAANGVNVTGVDFKACFGTFFFRGTTT